MKNEEKRIYENLKPFKPSDIVVYFALLVMFFALFLFFVILPTANKTNGFKILIDGKQVATYSYDGDFKLTNQSYKNLIVFDQTNLTITVYTDESKVHYNKIKIDDKNHSAKVIDANCSTSKECVYTPSLKDNSAIVCAPHKLKIVTLEKVTPSTPVTGGVR